jgi:hypothetical protein
MTDVNHKIRALAVAALALTLLTTGCGKSTSKSSNQAPPSNPSNSPVENNLDPIELSHDNYTQVASQSLKSILLNDAGANALGQAVKVTSNQTGQVVDMVTGVIFTLAPYPCAQGGNLTARAVVVNTNSNNLQIDLNRPLKLSFDASFNECRQNDSSLDGDVSLVLNTDFSQLINNPAYSLNSQLDVRGLAVEQPSMPSFVFDGTFGYSVISTDGISVTVGIESNNSFYFADESYQIFEFELEKTVNNANQNYSYSISSEFSDSANPQAYIAYRTLVPLSGTGFTPPTDGKLEVYGSNGTILIQALQNQQLFLQLDLGSDGSIDEEYYTTWEELVMNSFGITAN